MTDGARPRGDGCGSCRHFCNEPLRLEQASPGLASLSSGFGAVRAADGLCAVHERYVAAHASCDRFQRA